MQLYNTASRSFIPFEPVIGEAINIYVCGITPYDSAHLGHVFTFMTYDLLERLLLLKGHTVRMVRNVTDVDEPIYKKAAELGIPYTELAQQETEQFQSVMNRLNMLEPFAEPQASQYIPQMITAVEKLLKTNHAYELDGDIYFDTAKTADFGNLAEADSALLLKLFKRRGGDPARLGKRQPLDFLLWKSVTDPSDPAAWESPMGRGRPGWHIECSVMSAELLGLPLHIHGGGTDLIFPHHASEIAQAQGLGQPNVATAWVHTAPILLASEKMSKSLGNLVFAANLLEEYQPAVIRLSLMRHHYRTGGEWRHDLLDSSKALLAKITQAANLHKTGVGQTEYGAIIAALENDLDAPTAIVHLEALANTLLHRSASSNGPNYLGLALDLLGLQLADQPVTILL